ncbi:MAG: SDR family NAD(P)-dependent oxidoreductase, partial [Gammaproteobacteria bacterium]|nr:SDR family NAD(P)-dependent oxidoreductase [Gammaproteobacteria bacterium]
MTDQVILITGAAKRIGAGLARQFHQDGHNVLVHYHHSESEANGLIEALNRHRPGSAQALRQDLRHTDEFASFARQAREVYGHIDVVVNNASAFFPTPLESLGDEHWNQLIETNLKAPLFLSRCFADILEARSGSIINI